MVIWLVGLSGSGKTTIGKEIYKLWKPVAPNTVMVDGDDIRKILNRDNEPADFTMEGRLKLAKKYGEICLWLDHQDINVICCTISNFEEVYEFNRKNYSSYFQVFLDAPIELLKKRDPKGLYARALAGREKNVVGVDIPFKAPTKSDYVLRMDQQLFSPEVAASDISNKACNFK